MNFKVILETLSSFQSAQKVAKGKVDLYSHATFNLVAADMLRHIALQEDNAALRAQALTASKKLFKLASQQLLDFSALGDKDYERERIIPSGIIKWPIPKGDPSPIDIMRERVNRGLSASMIIKELAHISSGFKTETGTLNNLAKLFANEHATVFVNGLGNVRQNLGKATKPVK